MTNNHLENKISRQRLAIIITAITSVAAAILLAVMGTNGRVKVSMSKKFDLMNGDIKHVFIETVSDGSDAAFKLEAQWMNECAEKGTHLLNQIASPGYTKGTEMYKRLRDYLFKNWLKNL